MLWLSSIIDVTGHDVLGCALQNGRFLRIFSNFSQAIISDDSMSRSTPVFANQQKKRESAVKTADSLPLPSQGLELQIMLELPNSLKMRY